MSALKKDLSELTQGYLLAPGTLKHTTSLLDRVASRVQGAVPATLSDCLISLARELSERARVNRFGDSDHIPRAAFARCAAMRAPSQTTGRATLTDLPENSLVRDIETSRRAGC